MLKYETPYSNRDQDSLILFNNDKNEERFVTD